MRGKKGVFSEVASQRFAAAIGALDDPKNEPLKWLLSDALRQHAASAVGSHFLLETLAEPVRRPVHLPGSDAGRDPQLFPIRRTHRVLPEMTFSPD